MEIKILYWKDIKSMVDVQYEGRLPTHEQINADYSEVANYNIPDSIASINEHGFIIQENDTEEDITPDSYFELFNNGSNPLATPEGQQYIKDNGVRHTSMSVGDIITLNGLPFICDSEGWKRVYSWEY